MNSQLKKGLIDVCVLAELKRHESYGYAIVTDLQELINVSESTLYPVLKRLLAKKYIASENREYNGRNRKYYTITAAGEKSIDDFLIEWNQVENVIGFIKGK